jgi:hypothetical protein
VGFGQTLTEVSQRDGACVIALRVFLSSHIPKNV